MTMTDQQTDPRKPAKPRRKRTAAKAAPQTSSEFDGITVTDCPIACNEKRCVISGIGICAHPHKAGLQVSLQTPGNLRRLNAAKRILGKQKVDLTTA